MLPARLNDARTIKSWSGADAVGLSRAASSPRPEGRPTHPNALWSTTIVAGSSSKRSYSSDGAVGEPGNLSVRSRTKDLTKKTTG